MWSLVTLTGLVAVTLTAAMWFYVAVTPRIDPGFRRWAVGCALITAGLGCLLTAGRWPQLISVVATNVFTVLGGIEFARGVRAFFGVSPMTVFYRSMLAAFVAYTLVFTYLVPRLDLRLIGASVVFAAAFLDCACVTWRRAPRELRSAGRLTAAVSLAVAAAFLARAAVTLGFGTKP